MNERDSLRIRYEYNIEPEVRLRSAHGVWGGINPQGEVEINFYVESDKMPPYSESVITADGLMGHEMAPYSEEERVIVRNIHSKIIINAQTARAMLEWLEDKVSILENDDDGELSNSPFGSGQAFNQ